MIIALYGLQTPLDFTIGSLHFDANVTFTRWAIYLALLFVTLPFVVRTVQPVLIELDDRDGAGGAVARRERVHPFRRIVLPNILPGILSGVTMAFARAVGEIGSIILITGNLPFKTEVASVYIFQRLDGDPQGRPRCRSCCSDLLHRPALVGALRRYATRHEHG